MEEKTKCEECGTEVLKATSGRTGGFCMPCAMKRDPHLKAKVAAKKGPQPSKGAMAGLAVGCLGVAILETIIGKILKAVGFILLVLFGIFGLKKAPMDAVILAVVVSLVLKVVWFVFEEYDQRQKKSGRGKRRRVEKDPNEKDD